MIFSSHRIMLWQEIYLWVRNCSKMQSKFCFNLEMMACDFVERLQLVSSCEVLEIAELNFCVLRSWKFGVLDITWLVTCKNRLLEGCVWVDLVEAYCCKFSAAHSNDGSDTYLLFHCMTRAASELFQRAVVRYLLCLLSRRLHLLSCWCLGRSQLFAILGFPHMEEWSAAQ